MKYCDQMKFTHLSLFSLWRSRLPNLQIPAMNLIPRLKHKQSTHKVQSDECTTTDHSTFSWKEFVFSMFDISKAKTSCKHMKDSM